MNTTTRRDSQSAAVKLKTVDVLGLQLAVADYASAFGRVVALVSEERPTSVALCPTHPITEARLCDEFRRELASFDLLLPDGMPIVWMMKIRGAELQDRVYGPYFMRYVIERTPAPYRHFLFGGSSECLEQLSVSLKKIQPCVNLVGALSPPYRAWDEAAEQGFADVINEANPDFVWVALGGGKQERWIARNRARYRRGVFVAVGDAFELLAGRRSFAPQWMQRAGLTWMYRLAQEPTRLWKRYLLYNAAFAGFAIQELLRNPGMKARPRE